MTPRILDLTQIRTGPRPAWRFTLRLDAVEMRECFARRSGRAWTIYGPVRRDHGKAVPLATFAPALREQIAAALDAAISGDAAA